MEPSEYGFRPRLYPMIAGPTGAGKSYRVEKLAGNLSANYFRVTFGEWLPKGAASEAGERTLFRILNAVRNNKRVLLHLDELDKCWFSFETVGERSIANELWDALDKKFPVDEWYKQEGIERFAEEEIDTFNFEEGISGEVFFNLMSCWPAFILSC